MHAMVDSAENFREQRNTVFAVGMFQTRIRVTIFDWLYFDLCKWQTRFRHEIYQY